MTSVVTAMRATEPSITRLRPIRSAATPNSTPPSGRTANPTAKTASALSVDETGSSAGKKCGPRNAESRPKTIQSYHSRVLPSPRPSIALRVVADGPVERWGVAGTVEGDAVMVLAFASGGRAGARVGRGGHAAGRRRRAAGAACSDRTRGACALCGGPGGPARHQVGGVITQ